MKRLMTLLAAGTALAGCNTVPAAEPVAVAVAPVAPVTEVAAVEKPELGTYGFDTAGMDTTVLPGDNFYKYANGTWAQNTPIPADKSNYGMFTRLDDLSRQRTRVIIEEQAKDPSSKIGIAYNAFLDTAAIEAKGLAPFQPWLNSVESISSKADYAAVAARADRMGIGTPIGIYIGQDDKSPDRYIASVAQAGIGLPDRDYYLSDDAKMADIRAKYLAHLTNVLTLAGEANAAARARAIVDFETKIAKAHWTRVDSRDATKTYNIMTRDKFVDLTKGYDMEAFLDGIGIELEAARVDGSVLPGMTVFRGRVRIDPAVPGYPGDLLHEAGHVAVCDPAKRASLEWLEANPGEEMAAIAWSVAGAPACGLPHEVVFLDDGDLGAAESFRENFAANRTLGVPMLAWYGMTAEVHRAKERGIPAFPAMTRWLR